MNSLTHLDRLLARSLSPPPPPPAAAPPPLPPVRPELDAALASAAANGSVGGDGQDDTLPVASSSRSVPPSPAGPRDVGLPPTTATRRRAISGTSSPSLSVLLVSPSSPSSLASNPLGAASPTLSAVKRRRSTSARTASQQQQQQQAPARWLLARVLARLWAVLVALALWGSGGKRAMLAFGAGTGGPGARGRAATVGKRPAARRRAAAGAALKGRSPGTGSSTESDVPGPSSSTATRGAPSTPDDAPFPDPRTQAVDPALVLQSPGAPADGPAAPAALHQPALPTPTFALLPPPAAASQDDDEASAQAAAPLRSRLLTNPLGSTTLLRPASSLLSPSSFSATPSSLPPTPPLLSPPSAGRPSPAARKTTPFHKPKTLILDLDETLIHSTSRPMSALAPGSSGGSGGQGGLGRWGGGGGRGRGEGHMVEVFLGGRSTVYHVYKRPYVDYFLKKVSSWYTLVIFTASMQEYADPVIDWLDGGRGMFAKRLFRDSCVQHTNGAYIKDLACVDEDLESVALIDNSPVSYQFHQANGIPIDGWFSDPADQALLDLLPVLDSLRFTGDVRHVLGLRGF